MSRRTHSHNAKSGLLLRALILYIDGSGGGGDCTVYLVPTISPTKLGAQQQGHTQSIVVMAGGPCRFGLHSLGARH